MSNNNRAEFLILLPYETAIKIKFSPHWKINGMLLAQSVAKNLVFIFMVEDFSSFSAHQFSVLNEQ